MCGAGPKVASHAPERNPAATDRGLAHCLLGRYAHGFLGDTANRYVAADLGFAHGRVIRAAASLWCWGANWAGQLATGLP